MANKTFLWKCPLLMLTLTVFFAGCNTMGKASRGTGGKKGYSYSEDFGINNKIAILPFTGLDNQENEVMANDLGDRLRKHGLTIISKTKIASAIEKERNFQYSGLTDSDTVTSLGKELGAHYLMSGTITTLGSRKLLIVSIIKIDLIQQVAGAFLIYDTLNSLIQDESDESDFSNFAAELVEMMSNKNTSNLEELAVRPVEGEGTDKQTGEVLGQLLSIYLIRYGKYAVYPRTQKNLDDVNKEVKDQSDGDVSDDEAVKPGKAVNPPKVLQVSANTIEGSPLFQAGIFTVETHESLDGAKEYYISIEDGMEAIDFIAKKLSGIPISEQDKADRAAKIAQWKSLNEEARKKQREAEIAAVEEKERQQKQAEREQAAERRRQAARAAADSFLRNSGLGFSGWVGFILYTTGETVNEDGTTSEEKSGKLEWGADLELQLSRWFAIQGGFSMLKYVNSGTYLQTTVYQLPVVAKLNLSVGGDSISNFNGILSLYGGVGFNFGEPAYEYSGSFPVETVSSAPLSLITGGELGFGGVFRLFAGVRYIMDFEESTVRIDAHDFDQKRSLLILYLRATILIPFRKGR